MSDERDRRPNWDEEPSYREAHDFVDPPNEDPPDDNVPVDPPDQQDDSGEE